MMCDDLEAMAVPGCDGVLTPKIYGARDVLHAEVLVDHYECRNGVEPGPLEFVLLETVQAWAVCESMLATGPSCGTLFAGTARDTSVSRSIGVQILEKGHETLYPLSCAVLAVRAAVCSIPPLVPSSRFSPRSRRLGDMEFIEPNEAFAVQLSACLKC